MAKRRRHIGDGAHNTQSRLGGLGRNKNVWRKEGDPPTHTHTDNRTDPVVISSSSTTCADPGVLSHVLGQNWCKKLAYFIKILMLVLENFTVHLSNL